MSDIFTAPSGAQMWRISAEGIHHDDPAPGTIIDETRARDTAAFLQWEVTHHRSELADLMLTYFARLDDFQSAARDERVSRDALVAYIEPLGEVQAEIRTVLGISTTD